MSSKTIRIDDNIESSIAIKETLQKLVSSRIPGFYRLPVERRLAYLQRTFNFSDNEIAELREGRSLHVEHAVNMVENAIGVHGIPLGLALNFLVDDREFIVPMAIEEASIIAAASKAALMIRNDGGFFTEIDDPVMIGQIQVLDLEDPIAAEKAIHNQKARIIEESNLASPRMVMRGGGVRDIETRIVDAGANIGQMLIVHLLIDVREAMGANMINYACEAAGPLIEEISGGRVNLRILSNLADHRIARSSFSISFENLSTNDMSGSEVAQRMVEAGQFAIVDPYRATTHNKGIFNGIGAAAVALGQDWRALEAGGHAYAARNGQYSSLTKYWIEEDRLHGYIELPMQVGVVGGASNSHPGVRMLRAISGAVTSDEMAGLFASVGLAQNFAACLALCTVGIQKGHMALHARSVAISVGVPTGQVEEVATEMISRGDVKVAVAEKIFREIQMRNLETVKNEALPICGYAPGKVILFGEHATVYNYPGITAAIDIGLKVQVKRDLDGPRFLNPKFKQAFDVPESDQDIRLFSKAVDEALEIYGLQREPIAIGIESELVPGMGLGSSAAFSAALCSALRSYRDGEGELNLTSELMDDVQRLEKIFHGHPSGMDAATVLSDGVIWFRKGPPREIIPIQLRRSITGIVCIVEPGARTIDMVELVKHNREKDPDRIDTILDDIGQLTSDAGIALGIGDIPEVGKLMFRNHELLTQLGVSTPKLNEAVEHMLDRGVLGAKLTGSGGGGTVIALVNPEDQAKLLEEFGEKFALVYPFTVRA